jgi:hypothetical protein
MSILKHSRSARRVVKASQVSDWTAGRQSRGYPRYTNAAHVVPNWRWTASSLVPHLDCHDDGGDNFANLIPRSPATLPPARSLEVKRHSLPPTAAARRCSSAWHCGT